MALVAAFVITQSRTLCKGLAVMSCSDMDERAVSASAFQPYAYDTNTTSTPLLQHEGEDESSHNDTVCPFDTPSPLTSRTPSLSCPFIWHGLLAASVQVTAGVQHLIVVCLNSRLPDVC